MIPAREVGGDLYDFFRLDDRRLFFLVGDVAGKGLSASIFMAVSKALYKSATLRAPDADIGALMSAANAEVSRDNPEMLFVTAFAGILDLETGELAYCNAGHDNPYLLHPADATVRRIDDGDGPPLCAMDDFAYRGRAAAHAAGRAALRGHRRRDRGAGSRGRAVRQRARARRCCRGWRSGDATARDVVDALRADVGAFAAGAEPADDLTILALRWNGPGAPADARRHATHRRSDARRSANDDLDAPIARLGHAVGRRHEQLALAAPDGHDVLGRDAARDQPGAHDLGALLRQRVVDLIGADRVGVPDDQDVGHRVASRSPRTRASTTCLDSSVNSSLPSTKYSVNWRRAARLRGERRAEQRLRLPADSTCRPAAPPW